eukprot:3172159-Rhodomonas_salina.2
MLGERGEGVGVTEGMGCGRSVSEDGSMRACVSVQELTSACDGSQHDLNDGPWHAPVPEHHYKNGMGLTRRCYMASSAGSPCSGRWPVAAVGR